MDASKHSVNVSVGVALFHHFCGHVDHPVYISSRNDAENLYLISAVFWYRTLNWATNIFGVQGFLMCVLHTLHVLFGGGKMSFLCNRSLVACLLQCPTYSSLPWVSHGVPNSVVDCTAANLQYSGQLFIMGFGGLR